MYVKPPRVAEPRLERDRGRVRAARAARDVERRLLERRCSATISGCASSSASAAACVRCAERRRRDAGPDVEQRPRLGELDRIDRPRRVELRPASAAARSSTPCSGSRASSPSGSGEPPARACDDGASPASNATGVAAPTRCVSGERRHRHVLADPGRRSFAGGGCERRRPRCGGASIQRSPANASSIAARQ